MRSFIVSAVHEAAVHGSQYKIPTSLRNYMAFPESGVFLDQLLCVLEAPLLQSPSIHCAFARIACCRVGAASDESCLHISQEGVQTLEKIAQWRALLNASNPK
eukprot:gnl/TRDRNA2_/TRDRNA2_202011_c0_seq1.p1 gnl/TRDRNA2_/TRDRNA2_202011_c0~~gnl/TRDRNA2_/TRDRNA2_202011_c0_seq1.p1  ORF type:complete len:103 (+),score=8.88 gnl/TRDRNA2_/TRDRNA2_202011_c0_seq1:61-369(+)